MAYCLKIHRSNCKQRNRYDLGIIWDVNTFRCSVLFRCELCEPDILDSIQDQHDSGVFESFDAWHRDGVGERGFDGDTVVVGVLLCIFCAKTVSPPETGMERIKDPIEKETFAHSHCIKDSITIIARFLCHDHTASTECYGYDAHLFCHLRTSPVASGICRKVPAGRTAPFPSLTDFETPWCFGRLQWRGLDTAKKQKEQKLSSLGKTWQEL